MAIIFSILSSTAVWAFWIPLHDSTAGIIIFAVFYGIFSGAVIALTPALIADIRYVLTSFATSESDHKESCPNFDMMSLVMYTK